VPTPLPPSLAHVLPLDPLRYAPTDERPLRAKVRRLRADTRVVPHAHPWAQVAFSTAGVCRVTADDHTCIAPPSRAVWIPPGMTHAVTVVEDAELRTLYLLTAAPQALGGATPTPDATDWQRCRVLEVSPLLRELVQQLAVEPGRQAATARERHIAALVQDELAQARPVALGIRLPRDKRLRALCEAVLDDPARHATLAGWAGDAGASTRTVARLFREQLDTSFAQWRQQVLLAKAVSMSASKRPMNHIAAELGYASASAFSAMVRRSVGMSPTRLLAAGPHTTVNNAARTAAKAFT